MTHQKLKQAIIKANSHKTWIDEYDGHINIIRLENVLIAIFAKEVKLAKTGKWKDDYCKTRMDLLAIWDLTKTFDNQKDEVKMWLEKILVKNI